MDEFEENLEGTNTEGNDEGSTIVEITTGDGNSEGENPTKAEVVDTGNNTSESGGTTNEDGRTSDTSGTGSGTTHSTDITVPSETDSGETTTTQLSATIKIVTSFTITQAKIKIGYVHNSSKPYDLTNILNENGYCCLYDSEHGNYNAQTGIMTLTEKFDYDLEIDNDTYYFVFFYFNNKQSSNCIKMKGDQLKGSSSTALTSNDILSANDYSFTQTSTHTTEIIK